MTIAQMHQQLAAAGGHHSFNKSKTLHPCRGRNKGHEAKRTQENFKKSIIAPQVTSALDFLKI